METSNEETGTKGAVALTAAMDNEIAAASSGTVVDVAMGGKEEGKMTVKLIPLRSLVGVVTFVRLHTLPPPCTWSTLYMTPCRCNP